MILLGSSTAKRYPCHKDQYADIHGNDDGTVTLVQDHTCPKCKTRYAVKLKLVVYPDGKVSTMCYRVRFYAR